MKRSKDKLYRKWRIQVIRRDKRCVICNSTRRRAAHHIEDWSYHPDKRYLLSNGVTLCGHCHMNFHCNFKNSYREKCSKKDWDNFKSLVNYLRDKDLNKMDV